MKKLKTLAPVALMLLAGAAYAQDAGRTPSTQNQAQPGQQTQQSQSQQRAQQGQQRPSTSSTTLSTGATNNFATADMDKDGKLSVAELQKVMPDVKITDTDGDGFVNQAEAEAGITGLAFEGGSASDEIGEEEYGQIVALMSQSRTPGAAGAAGSRSGGAAGGAAGAGARSGATGGGAAGAGAAGDAGAGGAAGAGAGGAAGAGAGGERRSGTGTGN